MRKVLKYGCYDLLRSRWTVIYFLFFDALAWLMLWLGNDLNRGIASLLNITLIIVPLVSTLFGVFQFYNAREFVELLLAQPVRRRDVFAGLYGGIAVSLSLGYVLGVGIPFVAYGLFMSPDIFNFLSLLTAGFFLSFIFTGIAFIIALIFGNRLTGFGTAVLVWLFMAFIYDGLFLASLLIFEEYPVEKLAIALSVLNPIDLSRIMVMLKLDISALMGYTGAVFRNFFGTSLGISVSLIALTAWMTIPIFGFLRISEKKDF